MSSQAPRTTGRRSAAALAFVSVLAATLTSVLAPAGAGATSASRAITASRATNPDRATSPDRATIAPTCGGKTYHKTGGGTWVCSFDDEFNGTSLDTSAWTAVATSANGYHSGPDCFTTGKNNVRVGDGHLTLEVLAMPSPFTCVDPYGNYTTRYTAGQIVTHGKFAQLYGRFSIRAKFPSSAIAGLQSSLWLWPQNEDKYGSTWPESGEIDVAEEYSQFADRAIPFIHYTYDKATTDKKTGLNVVTNDYCMVSDVSAFHVYTLIWSPTELQISFDGHTCMVDKWRSSLAGNAPFNQPFGMQLTQTLGINTNAFDPALTQLPATTEVDWVRVWK